MTDAREKSDNSSIHFPIYSRFSLFHVFSLCHNDVSKINRYFIKSKPSNCFCPFGVFHFMTYVVGFTGQDCSCQHANPDGTHYKFSKGVDVMMTVRLVVYSTLHYATHTLTNASNPSLPHLVPTPPRTSQTSSTPHTKSSKPSQRISPPTKVKMTQGPSPPPMLSTAI